MKALDGYLKRYFQGFVFCYEVYLSDNLIRLRYQVKNIEKYLIKISLAEAAFLAVDFFSGVFRPLLGFTTTTCSLFL